RAQTVLSLTGTDTAAAEGWLELGVKLGSASAALELSHLYLARAGFKVSMVPARFGLPVLTDLETAPARGGRHAAFDACKPWYNGARLALRHSGNGFKECDADDLQAMITCVLCFMMHTPGKHHMAKFVERHIPQPADCVS